MAFHTIILPPTNKSLSTPPLPLLPRGTPLQNPNPALRRPIAEPHLNPSPTPIPNPPAVIMVEEATEEATEEEEEG